MPEPVMSPAPGCNEAGFRAAPTGFPRRRRGQHTQGICEAWTAATAPGNAPPRLQRSSPMAPSRTPMTFDPNAQLDPSQVTDVRGGSRLGGRGGGLAIGGCGLGLVLVIAYLLLGGDPSVLLNGGSGTGTVDTTGPNSSALAGCKT